VLLPLDGDGALYQQVYRALRAEILSRRLLPGGRLPSTRALAGDLGISRNIAILAYDQLLGEGYAEARRGSGTIVAPSLPEEWRAAAPPSSSLAAGARRIAAPRLARAGSRALAIVRRRPVRWDLQPARLPYDFRFGRPAFADFPHALWCRLLGRRARRATVRDLDYGPPEGREELREALAERLRRFRGIDVGPERIVIVNGSQQALDLVARVLLDPGDRVLIEEPHYLGARWVFIAAGAELVPGRVDEEGMQVPGPRVRGTAPRLAYVTPSHQFPTGVVLPAGRRLELLNWAVRTGAFVLEDDYDSEYRYGSLPIASLQGLDRDSRVIYVGTFSKVLFPALRLGYIVIPTDLVRRFMAVREAMDIFPPTLNQAVLADFIAEGHFARHIRRMRQIYGERRGALAKAIAEDLGTRLQVLGSPAGMHLTAALPKGPRDRRISVRAARQGLWVMPLSTCYLGEGARQGLVLGYGGTSAAEMPAAVRRLRTVLTSA
jgi:GntR family transcriptional regulator / MocR family aminotransferase